MREGGRAGAGALGSGTWERRVCLGEWHTRHDILLDSAHELAKSESQ